MCHQHAYCMMCMLELNSKISFALITGHSGNEVGLPKTKDGDDGDHDDGDEADGIYIRERGNYLTVSQPMLHGSHTNISGGFLFIINKS